jgi:hypothetical protein
VSGIDLTGWYSQSSLSKSASNGIQIGNLADDLVKGHLGKMEAERAPKTLFTDPMSLNYAMGFKNKKDSLSYDVMRRTAQQLSIIGAIIQTRCNQIANFSAPYRQTKSLGYQIKHRDPLHETKDSELEFIKELEDFIANCGKRHAQNPYTTRRRDDFETFLKKIVRDSLTYDQSGFEIVPDLKGKPFEFLAVDAATLRLAAPSSIVGPNQSWFERDTREKFNAPFRFSNLYDFDPERPPAYIQVVNGQIQNVYYEDELAFGIRNPRTDIYVQGYGYGELEQLVSIVTSHLYAEEYNRRFFMQSSSPKGILNLKGENFTGDQLEAFRRQWKANVEGVENSWRTPILQAEQGVEWINLNTSNKDMEYGAWLEYLVKISTAVFQIDPAELNFDLSGGVQQTPLFESSQEWKLKASKDKGLKPLLRFLAKLINKHIIQKIDDNYVFDFVGLDELTEQEKHELRKEQVASYMTLNEIRKAEDLEALPMGDLPLNPAYIQLRAQLANEEQQKQTQQMNAMQGGQPGQPPPQPGQEGQGPITNNKPAAAPMPYADNFGKSIDYDVDSWIDYARR